MTDTSKPEAAQAESIQILPSTFVWNAIPASQAEYAASALLRALTPEALERVLEALERVLEPFVDDRVQTRVGEARARVRKALSLPEGEPTLEGCRRILEELSTARAELAAAHDRFLALGYEVADLRKAKDQLSEALDGEHAENERLGKELAAEKEARKVAEQFALCDPVSGIPYGKPQTDEGSRVTGTLYSLAGEPDTAVILDGTHGHRVHRSTLRLLRPPEPQEPATPPATAEERCPRCDGDGVTLDTCGECTSRCSACQGTGQKSPPPDETTMSAGSEESQGQQSPEPYGEASERDLHAGLSPAASSESGGRLTWTGGVVTHAMAPFEREVAQRIRDGQDYWFGFKGRVGSRGPAQALSRLRKKAFIVAKPGDVYELTPAGVAELERAQARRGR